MSIISYKILIFEVFLCYTPKNLNSPMRPLVVNYHDMLHEDWQKGRGCSFLSQSSNEKSWLSPLPVDAKESTIQAHVRFGFIP